MGQANGFPVDLLVFVILAVLIVPLVVPLRWWLVARRNGLDLGLTTIAGMRLRGTSPAAIIWPLLAARREGIELDVRSLEAHHLAGGNVVGVVNALIEARRANEELSFRQAAAMDLARGDDSPGSMEPTDRRPTCPDASDDR